MPTKMKNGKTHPWKATFCPGSKELSQFQAEEKAVPAQHNPLKRLSFGAMPIRHYR